MVPRSPLRGASQVITRSTSGGQPADLRPPSLRQLAFDDGTRRRASLGNYAQQLHPTGAVSSDTSRTQLSRLGLSQAPRQISRLHSRRRRNLSVSLSVVPYFEAASSLSTRELECGGCAVSPRAGALRPSTPWDDILKRSTSSSSPSAYSSDQECRSEPSRSRAMHPRARRSGLEQLEISSRSSKAHGGKPALGANAASASSMATSSSPTGPCLASPSPLSPESSSEESISGESPSSNKESVSAMRSSQKLSPRQRSTSAACPTSKSVSEPLLLSSGVIRALQPSPGVSTASPRSPRGLLAEWPATLLTQRPRLEPVPHLAAADGRLSSPRSLIARRVGRCAPAVTPLAVPPRTAKLTAAAAAERWQPSSPTPVRSPHAELIVQQSARQAEMDSAWSALAEEESKEECSSTVGADGSRTGPENSDAENSRATPQSSGVVSSTDSAVQCKAGKAVSARPRRPSFGRGEYSTLLPALRSTESLPTGTSETCHSPTANTLPLEPDRPVPPTLDQHRVPPNGLLRCPSTDASTQSWRRYLLASGRSLRDWTSSFVTVKEGDSNEMGAGVTSAGSSRRKLSQSQSFSDKMLTAAAAAVSGVDTYCEEQSSSDRLLTAAAAAVAGVDTCCEASQNTQSSSDWLLTAAAAAVSGVDSSGAAAAAATTEEPSARCASNALRQKTHRTSRQSPPPIPPSPPPPPEAEGTAAAAKDSRSRAESGRVPNYSATGKQLVGEGTRAESSASNDSSQTSTSDASSQSSLAQMNNVPDHSIYTCAFAGIDDTAEPSPLAVDPNKHQERAVATLHENGVLQKPLSSCPDLCMLEPAAVAPSTPLSSSSSASDSPSLDALPDAFHRRSYSSSSSMLSSSTPSTRLLPSSLAKKGERGLRLQQGRRVSFSSVVQVRTYISVEKKAACNAVPA